MSARVLAGLLAAASLAAGVVLARAHPLAPMAALAGLLACAAATAWRPGFGLFLLAAGLPCLDFAPWTGGLVFEEFDLLVLAVAAGAHARMAWSAVPTLSKSVAAPLHAGFLAAALVFALASAIALQRGLAAGGPLRLDWFQGETDPLNAWRVFKPVAGIALLWWPVRRLVRDDARAAFAWLARGMVAGVAIVGLMVLAERAAYPGAFDFSGPYRTTAWFWEMHVGGAAIDADLALATPFVVWALWTARSPLRWGLAAALALLAAYAILTTFARGLYLGAAVGLAVLGVLGARRAGGDHVRALILHSLAIGAALLAVAVAMAGAFAWDGRAGVLALTAGLAALGVLAARRVRRIGRRRTASLGLVLALMLEAALVLGLGTFMRERVQASQNDLGSRLAHWRAGVGLLRGTPDWLAGIGLGRLPAEYAARVPGGEFPGALRFAPGHAAPGSVILSGPGRSDLHGLFALTQRIALRPAIAPHAEMEVRATRPTRVRASVCEIHLLYPRTCQRAAIVLLPGGAAWHRIAFDLRGPALTAGGPVSAWAWPRRAAFALAVETPQTAVEFRRLALQDDAGGELLANADFSQGLAHWLPVAQDDFVPWHLDNLVLEVLVERGLPACLALGACLALALAGLLRAPGRADPAAPFLAAALCGVLAVGLVSSVMDVPRVAFLMLLLAVFSAELAAARRPRRAGEAAAVAAWTPAAPGATLRTGEGRGVDASV